MNRFHALRLAKLAKYMKTVKPERFSIDDWVDGNEDESFSKEVISKSGLKVGDQNITAEQINICGTTACLLGHAATMPEFRKRGLKMETRVYENVVGHDYEGKEIVEYGITGWVVLHDERTGEIIEDESFEAGQRFFGLTIDESFRLFSPEGYDDGDLAEVNVTPRLTVKQIKTILRENNFADVAATI